MVNVALPFSSVYASAGEIVTCFLPLTILTFIIWFTDGNPFLQVKVIVFSLSSPCESLRDFDFTSSFLLYKEVQYRDCRI